MTFSKHVKAAAKKKDVDEHHQPMDPAAEPQESAAGAEEATSKVSFAFDIWMCCVRVVIVNIHLFISIIYFYLCFDVIFRTYTTRIFVQPIVKFYSRCLNRPLAWRLTTRKPSCRNHYRRYWWITILASCPATGSFCFSWTRRKRWWWAKRCWRFCTPIRLRSSKIGTRP